MIILLLGLVLVLIITSSVSMCLRESYRNKTEANAQKYNTDVAAASLIGLLSTFGTSGTSISPIL